MFRVLSGPRRGDTPLMARLRRAKQAGFTLLELLVVVAILAAVAGTATIVLQDTDRRASAAAHVAMMDELKKGVMTFSVMRSGAQPDNYDSLLEGAGGAATALMSRLAQPLNDTATPANSFLKVAALPAGVTAALNTSGITKLRVIDLGQTPAGAGTVGTCANLQLLINDKTGNTVINNIYNSASGFGCGTNYTIADAGNVAIWVGGQRRVLGSNEPELGATGGNTEAATTDYATAETAQNGAGFVGTATQPIVARLLMAVGFGPSCTLFDGNLGALSTVPAYRHTAKDEYNRFIGLFEVADNVNGAGWTAVPPQLVAVVDGAGDTKEEEIGEFDGTRSTL